MSAPALAPKTFTLTARELDVLRELVKDGPSDEQIAERLGIGYNTVKTYMKSILRRSGCPTRTALVVAVHRRAVTPTEVTQARDGEWFKTLADLGL